MISRARPSPWRRSPSSCSRKPRSLSTDSRRLLPWEAEEAAAFISWCRMQRWHGTPLADLILHIPNGAHLAGTPRQRAAQMARLKAQGLQVGAPDYFLPIPVVRVTEEGGAKIHRESHGLFLELKRQEKGTVSPEQAAYHDRLRREWYEVKVCRGWVAAASAVTRYLWDRPFWDPLG